MHAFELQRPTADSKQQLNNLNDIKILYLRAVAGITQTSYTRQFVLGTVSLHAPRKIVVDIKNYAVRSCEAKPINSLLICLLRDQIISAFHANAASRPGNRSQQTRDQSVPCFALLLPIVFANGESYQRCHNKRKPFWCICRLGVVLV